MHQILWRGRINGVQLYLLQNSPSPSSPLNLHNLALILVSLWTTPCYLGGKHPHTRRDLRVATLISDPSFILYQHPQSHWWYQLGSAKGNHPYHLYIPYPNPFHVSSYHFIHQHLTTPGSGTLNYPKLCPPRSHRKEEMISIDHLHTETKMLPVQDHLSLNCSQFLAKALQPNNPSSSLVAYPFCIRNKKKIPFNLCFSISVERYSTHLQLSESDHTKSLHTKAVSDCKSLLTRNRVLQTASPQRAVKKAFLPRAYRTTLSQLCSFFCSSLYSYVKRIGLIPSLLCPSCRVEPHTTDHVFAYSSHPTPLTVRDLWEHPRLTSEFLFGLPFFDLPPLPEPSNNQDSWRESSSVQHYLYNFFLQLPHSKP